MMKNSITESVLKTELEKAYSKLKMGRYSRFKQVAKYFPNGGRDITVFSGFEAEWILEEFCSNYINGSYLSCVILCQIMMERALSSFYAMTERESELFTKGFKTLIDAAERDNCTTKKSAIQLDKLRQIRNQYNHPYMGLRKSSIMEHVGNGEFKNKTYRNPYMIVKKDAEFSIRLVSNFYKMRSKNRKMDL